MEQRADYAISPVPAAERTGFLGNLFVFSGWTVWAGGPLFAVFLLQGLPMWQALLATLVGGAVLFLVVTFLGKIATEKGVTSYLLSNYSFGQSGMRFVGIIMFITISGWFAVSTGWVGNVIAGALGVSNWYIIPPLAFIFGVAAIMGFRAVTVVGYVTMPLLIIGFPALLIAAWVQNPGGIDVMSATVPVIVPGAAVTLVYAMGLMINQWIMGCASSPDLTRYTKSFKHVVMLAALTLIPLYTFIYWMGAPYGVLTGNPDVVGSLIWPTALFGGGWAVVGLLLAIISVWNTADVQCWVGSLGLSSVTKKPKLRWLFALLVCAVGAGLGPVIWGFLFIWLDILGTIIPPLVAVWLIDYYVVRRGEYPDEAPNRLFNYTAYLAWAIGAGLGYWTGVTQQWGIAAINGSVITALCYWGFEMLKARMAQAK